ncbi:MAG TPA: DUF2314 domain-containing protein, partial [Polyangiaceae bacterium]|nr:DUF2314 domain-containing protein [Polyangiaceae bacterium]
GRLLSSRSQAPGARWATPGPASSGSGGSGEPSSDASASTPGASAVRAEPPLRRPASSSVTLGVVTDRTEEALRPLIDRDALAALVQPRHCGDESACDAVRATIRDERATTIGVVPTPDWNFGRLDLDGGADNLSPAERANVARRPRVVAVTVVAATSAQQLALRAAFAATAALADATAGFVHDPLLARVERAADFAQHAVTAPLQASTFRRDRVELLYEPKEPGVVRVLTAGLSRWGAPDVEAARVPDAARESVAQLVLAVAAALADGATAGPIVLSEGDVARARGFDDPVDAGRPPLPSATVDLVSVPPESGDPNDFLARIEPPSGDGPVGYLELAERFFGPVLASPPPEPAALERRRLEQARERLATALAGWTAKAAAGDHLQVRLPFAIPGEAGFESLWVDVTGSDARTVTGRIVDEPLGATDVAKGDQVTRTRDQVQELRWRHVVEDTPEAEAPAR